MKIDFMSAAAGLYKYACYTMGMVAAAFFFRKFGIKNPPASELELLAIAVMLIGIMIAGIYSKRTKDAADCVVFITLFILISEFMSRW